jgi:hypothetical protein
MAGVVIAEIRTENCGNKMELLIFNWRILKLVYKPAAN